MNETSPIRAIKSYVRRQGRMSLSLRNALTDLWALYGLPGDNAKKINFEQIFGNNSPLVLEIGFGMGQMLLHMAATHPEQNYIGVEVHRPGIGLVLQEIQKQSLKNIRIFNDDIFNVLNHHFNDNILSEIWILFPDPWPKRRHHKRRLIQPSFIDLLCQKLKVNSSIYLATDCKDYAISMMNVLSNTRGLKNKFGEYTFAPKMRQLTTKFEARGIMLGSEIWELAFVKI